MSNERTKTTILSKDRNEKGEICAPRSRWKAEVKGQPGRWGVGSTEAEAIGDLVLSHRWTMGIQIERV